MLRTLRCYNFVEKLGERKTSTKNIEYNYTGTVGGKGIYGLTGGSGVGTGHPQPLKSGQVCVIKSIVISRKEVAFHEFLTET